MPYLYFTDGSKQQDNAVGGAFLVVPKGTVLGESKLRLSDGAIVFAAKVHVIKEAITDVLGDFDVYSDSRSVLEALKNLVPWHRTVAEIKDLVKQSGVKITELWIRAHVGHSGNKWQMSWQRLPLKTLRLMW